MDGTGALDFESISGRTVVRQAQAQSPLKFLNPKNRGTGAWVYTSSYGGGLVDGDAISLKLRLRPKSEAVLLTQSATKVYRSERGTRQTVEARIGTGATLVSLPDPMICFEKSRFSQHQAFHLEKDASLLLVDGLNCGRHASGECWKFDRYESRIDVFQNEKRIFFESLVLDSTFGNLASRNAPFNAFAIVLLMGPAFESQSLELRNRTAAEPLQAQTPVSLSASTVAQGAGTLIRLASQTTEALSLSVRELLSFLPSLLGDDPWARKW